VDSARVGAAIDASDWADAMLPRREESAATPQAMSADVNATNADFFMMSSLSLVPRASPVQPTGCDPLTAAAGAISCSDTP
jgi:hypothetical protein